MVQITLRILALALLATIASAEPPVQGYNYRRPVQSSYTAPTNQYLPPSNQYLPPSSDYTAPAPVPSSTYLPSFGHRGPSQHNSGQYTHSGHNSGQYTHSGHNSGQYTHSGQESGHDSYDNGHGHGHESEVPKSYEFGYSVKDAQSGNDYDRHETSDGNVVRGEYRVALPDGRTQIVTYHADWQTGFHADVRYEGEARYPEPTNTHGANLQAGYNYNAPSDFSGSLTGFHGNQNSYQRQPSTVYGPSGFH